MQQTLAPGVDLAELSRRHLSPVLARYFERSWSHGDGHLLFDRAGRAYLDFVCGIATTVLGHRHPRVTAAIHEQVDRLVHVTNGLGYIEPVARLAELVAESLPEPLDTVFFANSGSEAIEGALKLARRVTGRPGIVAFSGGFHGRTFAALTVTSSNLNYRLGYEPLLPSVYLAPFPDVYRDPSGDEEKAAEMALAGLRRVLADEIPPRSVAAILIEPVQGEGGYNPAPVPFLRALRALCDEHGILLVADEIQSGYGRSGRMWAFERAGIVPDVVCLGKAIANGLPLAAIVTPRELQERWGLGSHGSTFGGNPVACAAGVAVLETIRDEDLVANAAERGEELSAGLRAIAAEERRIGDVRGPGLMVGVELVQDPASRRPDGAAANQLIARCADEGLLLITCGAEHQVVRWIAPLDVSADEIQGALATFRAAVRATLSS
ncbi:MAG: aminotransferase class III-fold pyridoxal phosphate-dependent enzyme [Chloroflexota bacterium]|nr:aminotransferase class III-fold pyridoxal phosphate-dependent enzyme [Chloroflexota bacterium]